MNGGILHKSVGIVARYDKRKALKLAQDLAKHLQTRGLEVHAEDTLKGKISGELEFTKLSQMKTDFIITMGGDGTILRTSISAPKPQPPILGINMGVRGFLTEVEPKEAFNAVEKCLSGECTIEKCMKLQITADGITFPDALNEVLILADEPAKMLYTRILKDTEPILDCQADGFLVSTQTGSTGYSLSAGGPVLDPEMSAYVLTPLCALSAFRPIVFPADTKLTIGVDKPRKILVIIDGRYRQSISSALPGVTITRSKHEASFIRFKENFYHRLRSRLLFKGIG